MTYTLHTDSEIYPFFAQNMVALLPYAIFLRYFLIWGKISTAIIITLLLCGVSVTTEQISHINIQRRFKNNITLQ
jgi:hypothetical protein